jgi:RNA-directed DNA polymerase
MEKRDQWRRSAQGAKKMSRKIWGRFEQRFRSGEERREERTHPYGFRPGRGAIQAVKDLQAELHKSRTAVVLEIDIRRCFDTIPHGKLQEILRERVNDGAIVRLIGQWLHAGVMDNGTLKLSDVGTPQCGVISPLLMNIYMHTVLDQWFQEGVVPRLEGKARLIRYADDAVFVFENDRDARRVMEVLPKRFARFGLTLHSDKTGIINFCKPRGIGKSGTFSFLGFTYYWGYTRKGFAVVKLKTAKDRLSRATRRMNQWLKENRHAPVKWQHGRLRSKLKGHYGYFGISHNMRSLQVLFFRVRTLWWKWLSRRSGKSRLSYERYSLLLQKYTLPEPTIVHRLF